MLRRTLGTLALLTFGHVALAGKATSTLQFSPTAYSVVETTGTVVIAVTRTGSSSGPESVHYATVDGTAFAGWDYVPASGTLTWASNDGSPKNFSIEILDDSRVENDETFSVVLSNPRRGQLGAGDTAAVSIVSDDQYGALRFSSVDYSAAEADGAALVTVERAGGRAGEVSVAYSTRDDTARAGEDYVASSGTLTWGDGDDTPKSINVPLIDDNVAEPDETVQLRLEYVSGGATLGSPDTAVLTVGNDDLAGSLQFSDLVYAADESDGFVTVTVTRNWGSDGPVRADYDASDGTAVAGSDYGPAFGTLFWEHGDSAPKSFTVPLLADGEEEGEETVALTLANAAGGATLGGPNRAIVTIADADGPAGHVINTGGGRGGRAGGTGNGAGSVSLVKHGGTGDLEIRQEGSVDAGFEPTPATPNLGSNPLVVTQDTDVPMVDYEPEPPAGTPYLYAFDSRLFVSDGDGLKGDLDSIATGLHVAQGVTVRFGAGSVDNNIAIQLSDDVLNDGTITTGDLILTGRRSGIRFWLASYYGTGTIDTSAHRAGQTGGYVEIQASGSIYHHGDIFTYGGAATDADGGTGRYVLLWSQDVVETTGQVVTHGGHSVVGKGGDGGNISVRAYHGLNQAGEQNTRGGNGITAGGSGAGVLLQNDRTGEVRISGRISTAGGSAVAGPGASGGDVTLSVRGSTVRWAADVDTRGGHTIAPGADAGGAGFFHVDSFFYDGGTPFINTTGDDVPAGDLLMSGWFMTAGGSTLRAGSGSGGWGGSVDVFLNAQNHPRTQRLLLAGYARIDAAGGNGATGGAGGGVELTSSNTYDAQTGGYPPAGGLLNEAEVLTVGGDVLFDASGGVGSGGQGGDVDLNAYGLVDNSARVETSGGHDGGGLADSAGLGGGAGRIYFDSGYLGITNTGHLIANGGDGMRQGGAPFLVHFNGPAASNSGDITSNGGNADPQVAGSVGGNGGAVWFDVSNLTSQTGAISVKGGTGETPGSDGAVFPFVIQ